MTAAAISPWDDEFFGETEKEVYDAFLNAETPNDTAAVAASSHQNLGRGRSRTDIEEEYEHLSQPSEKSGDPLLSANGALAGPTTTYALDDDDDDVDCSALQSAFVQDCRPPELPAAPPEFSAEDLRLRDALAEFYLRHRAENLSNINNITAQYRGRGTAQLIAALAVKYRVRPVDAVELLSSVLYTGSLFEHGLAPTENERIAAIEKRLSEFESDIDGDISVASDRAVLLERCIEASASSGSDEMLRALCFRGLQERQDMRSQIWKILLGCLPIKQKSEWSSLEAEARSSYAQKKNELLVVTGDGKLEIKAKGGQLMDAVELLQQIQKDVDRTQHELVIFQQPALRASLISLLFMYAQLHPDIGYVQGMNELAAVLLYVQSAELPRPAHLQLEADAFWLFCSLMDEVKTGFIKALETPDNGQQTPAAHVERLLKNYDPELAGHLQQVAFPTSIFTFRWCSLLFTQDMPLQEVLRFWDSFISDPRRFEFVHHVCLATFLSCREEMLHLDEQGALANILRAAPRRGDVDVLLKRAWAICAFERRGLQQPVFPGKSAAQIVQDLSGWAQTAAVRAQQLGLGVARKVQSDVAPVMKERMGQASGNAKIVAQGGMQAMKAWLEQDNPVPAPLTRPETYQKAQTTVASFWQAVRSTGAAAVNKTQQLVSQNGQNGQLDKDSS